MKRISALTESERGQRMAIIRLLDARRGLYRKCEELFGDARIAESIYRFLCDGIEECEDADVVEVVRCKDCIIHDICRYRLGLGENGFCSQGRKDYETD